jgi:hypothetical protein
MEMGGGVAMNAKMRELVSYVGEGRIMDARSLFEEGCEAVKAGYLRIDSSRHQAYFVPTAAGTSLTNDISREVAE